MRPTLAEEQLDPDAEWQARLQQEMGVEDGVDEDLSDQYARCVWGICHLTQHTGQPPTCLLNGCYLPESLVRCMCWLL